MTSEKQHNAAQSDGAADAPPADQDFDAALAEIGSGDEAPAEAAADIPADVPIEGSTEDPAPAPAAAPDTSAAAEAPADEPQDIWMTADPKLREAYENERRDYEHRVNSLKGRQAALERELQAFRQQQANQGGQQQEQPQRHEDQGQQGQPSKLSSEEAAQLREDYPDLAGPLLDKIEEQSALLKELEQGVGGYRQEKARQAEEAQQRILEESHPDWSAAVTDDRFEGWLGTQPTAIRQAFIRNAEGWVDGRDAALVIGQFKADVGFGRQAAPAQGSGGNQVPDKRQRQLANGRDAGTQSPSVSSSGPDDQDFDGWLDRLTAMESRQASRV